MRVQTPIQVVSRAFSLIEVIAVTAMIGILASLGYSVFSNMTTSINEKKLQSELAALNTSVSSYLAFGGNLDDADTPAKVLDRLRSAASSDMVKRIPGLSSAMINRRMAAVYQSEEQAKSNQLRVVWNAAKKKFESTNSGDTGICAFYLMDEADAPTASGNDSRQVAMLYAKDDTWVWDYNDEIATVPAGPTTIATSNPGISTTPPVTTYPETDPGTDPEIASLLPPSFSQASGEYEITDFNLPLTLSNPNTAGISDIYYSINYGSWSLYQPGSTIEVLPNQKISAQSISKSAKWKDSSRIDENYLAKTKQLKSPVILTSSGNFGAISDRLVGLILQNPNPESDGKLQYRINNGEWLDYNQYLLLDRADFANGATIAARVYPMESYYEPSEIASRVLPAAPVSFFGSADGVFSNPVGDSKMVSSLGGSTSSNYFTWGEIANPSGKVMDGLSKNTLAFNTATAFNAGLGDAFYIGSLTYKNGSTLLGTNATGVDFNLGLDFDLAGNHYGTGFSFDFDLESTKNTKDIWESADYVSIDQANSTSMFEIDGSTFELSLKFGETTTEGFATTDSFHVIEDGTAAANVYATVFERTASRGNVNADGTLRAGGISAAELNTAAATNGGWWAKLLNWLTSFWS